MLETPNILWVITIVLKYLCCWLSSLFSTSLILSVMWELSLGLENIPPAMQSLSYHLQTSGLYLPFLYTHFSSFSLCFLVTLLFFFFLSEFYALPIFLKWTVLCQVPYPWPKAVIKYTKQISKYRVFHRVIQRKNFWVRTCVLLLESSRKELRIISANFI